MPHPRWRPSLIAVAPCIASVAIACAPGSHEEQALSSDFLSQERTSAWSPPDVKPADWMRDIYEKKPTTRLRDVVIPGTHDSATSKMTAHSDTAKDAPDICKSKVLGIRQACVDKSLAQSLDIQEQLTRGIRYLDLRVESNENTGWTTVHGMTSHELTDVVDQIGGFAQSHGKEIVIVDFQDLKNFTTAEHDKLAGYLKGHPTLGPRIAWGDFFSIATSGNPADVTFDQLWRAGRNVIILSSLARSPGLFWPRTDETITSPWANEEDHQDVNDFLVRGIATRPWKGFYVSQAVATPSPLGVKSLRDRAMELNPWFDWLLPTLNEKARAVGKTLNIVIADFFQDSDLVDISLTLNLLNSNRVKSIPVDVFLWEGNIDPNSSGMQDVVCKLNYRPESINLLTDNPYSCTNDEIRSATFRNFKKGAKFCFFDDPGGSWDEDDATCIEFMRDAKPGEHYSLGSFDILELDTAQAPYKVDGTAKLTHHHKNKLDGKISHITMSGI